MLPLRRNCVAAASGAGSQGHTSERLACPIDPRPPNVLLILTALHIWEILSTLIKAFCIVSLILIVLVLLVYGAGVFIPLAVALLLWFFINALAKAFQRLWSRRLGPLRGLALLLALLTLLAASLFIADVVVTNLSAIGASPPISNAVSIR